ncbi:MAG: GumC family protein, partial [Deltaproteobacteria bacterium]|nr:GumC family protein [Deltaproteobacteria bacterium]
MSKQAVQWLTDQLKEVKAEVEESERKLQEYRVKHQLVSMEGEDKENIVQQKLAELSTELTKARTETIGRETLYRQLLDSSNDPNLLESLPPVINNLLIQDLKNKYATLSAEYFELSERYGPKHPKIIRLQAQIGEMRDKISHEVQKIAASVETEYKVAKAREEMLEKSLDEQKQTALDSSQKVIEYGVLRRQAESNKAIYDSLLNRFKEADITSDLQTGNIEILDRARIPLEPSKPRKGRNMLLAMIMGIFLGVGSAFLLEHLDNRVKLPQDV